MGRIGLAFRAFFRILFDVTAAERVAAALRNEALPTETPQTSPSTRTAKKPQPPTRSDALTLLAALQRDARFLDLVQESLDGYSDSQIGAAARDVLRDCRGVLDRLFAITPLCDSGEGAAVQVPEGFDPARFRLSGNVTGSPPHQGQLVHHGWAAARCDLPKWSGQAESELVVAPAEVEIT